MFSFCGILISMIFQDRRFQLRIQGDFLKALSAKVRGTWLAQYDAMLTYGKACVLLAQCPCTYALWHGIVVTFCQLCRYQICCALLMDIAC